VVSVDIYASLVEKYNAETILFFQIEAAFGILALTGGQQTP
jgi:hypothetical protein